MPIIMCLYCQYLGCGSDVQDTWDDVVDHEMKYHYKELKDDGMLYED